MATTTLKMDASAVANANPTADSLTGAQWLAQTEANMEKADKVVFIHFRVIYVGEVNLSSQSFLCRFDMMLYWKPEVLGQPSHDETAHKTFDPILRFPQSKSWSEVEDLGVALALPQLGLVGERRTIEGTFTCALEMEAFPFDVQALDVVIHLGRDKVSGRDLTFENGYRLAQAPFGANMIAPQISDAYTFRPCRYTLTHTTRLESPKARSEYMLSVVVSRRAGYYVSNHYAFLFIILVLSLSFFAIGPEDYANRLIANMTLFLIAVAFRFSVQDGLPKISYLTAFDHYMLFTFVFLFVDPVVWSAAYIAFGGRSVALLSGAGDYSGAVAVLDVLDQWNAYLFYAKLALLGLGHAALYVQYRGHARAAAKAIADIGALDPALLELLQSNGVRLRADGTVINMDKYIKLTEG